MGNSALLEFCRFSQDQIIWSGYFSWTLSSICLIFRAVGNLQYGKLYYDKLLYLIQRQVEKCDSLQCFFLIHSMGGGMLYISILSSLCPVLPRYCMCLMRTIISGTGSGIGTAILSLLQDEFPDIYKFCIPVYPSANDDVVTSPYNTVLAMEHLTNFADCVIPLENQVGINLSLQAVYIGSWFFWLICHVLFIGFVEYLRRDYQVFKEGEKWLRNDFQFWWMFEIYQETIWRNE